MEQSATSQGVRVVFLHKSIICVCRPIIFDEILCPDPGMWTVFVLTAVLVFVDVVSVGTVGNSDLAGVSEVHECVPVVIMSESVRSRMAARGWVTRASRKLDKLCNVRDIDNLELRDAIEELDKRLETLDNAQSVVELELTVEQGTCTTYACYEDDGSAFACTCAQ